MSIIRNIKEDWARGTPTYKNKVSKVLSSGTEKAPAIANPFLDKSGKLINPYINYQKVLNDSGVSTKAKEFIQQATGLSPTVQATPIAQAQATPTASTSVVPQSSNIATPAPTAPSGGNVPQSNSSIAQAAQKYIGTPYVWGGESTSEGGMDCSGFVYNALKDAGYKVGRTTAQGYRNQGTAVSKTDMQPGDLVFFGKGGEASHIGIYAGDGKMIHSSGGSKNTKNNPGKGVSITNVDYRSDFIEARRY